MNLEPKNQLRLFELDKEFNFFINLFKNNKLPNKILFSGQKGLGKCTLAYHLINFFLSYGENDSYNIKNFEISENNRSYRLIKNGSNPNFHLVDILPEKKNIDINQIRELISKMNKSSFNTKPRFILIDNVEYLNVNSVNALLKNLEEPNENIYFILIKNERKISATLSSRCLNFNISKSNKQILNISNKLLNKELTELINKDLLNYYITPGQIYNLIRFSKNNNLDLKNIRLDQFLKILIDKNYYKKDISISSIIYDLIEFYIIKSSNLIKFDYYNLFLEKLKNIKTYNLDEESLFLEFKSKILNE